VGEVAAVQRREQIGFDDVAAAREVHERSASGSAPSSRASMQAARGGRERQQVHQHLSLRQRRAERRPLTRRTLPGRCRGWGSVQPAGCRAVDRAAERPRR
jgi:hypothetical protein